MVDMIFHKNAFRRSNRLDNGVKLLRRGRTGLPVFYHGDNLVEVPTCPLQAQHYVRMRLMNHAISYPPG